MTVIIGIGIALVVVGAIVAVGPEVQMRIVHVLGGTMACGGDCPACKEKR